MTKKEAIGKTAYYRPVNERDFKSAVITKILTYVPFAGIVALSVAVMDNGDEVSLSACYFLESSID